MKNKKNRDVYIYGLVSSSNKEYIRYVGRTVELNNRTSNHIHPNNGDLSDKADWVRKESSLGNIIFPIILDIVPERLSIAAERFWIDKYVAHGNELFNNDLKTKETRTFLEYKLRIFFRNIIYPLFVIFVALSVVHMFLFKSLWIWDFAYFIFMYLIGIIIQKTTILEMPINKNVCGGEKNEF